MTEKTVRFRDWDCTIQKGRYANGRVRLDLIDADDGSPVATATVNLVDARLWANHVAIKDSSENAGVLAALIEAGVIRPTGETVRSGFVDVPVCELLPPYREHAAGVDSGRRRVTQR